MAWATTICCWAKHWRAAGETKSCLSVKFGALRDPAGGWVMVQRNDIFPLIGASRRGQFRESLGALKVHSTPDDLSRLNEAIPKDAAAGERYAPVQMAHLDSDRRR